MGDRALIQLVNEEQYSPSLYLHWKGSEALTIIERTKKRVQGRLDDIEYAFARLVQIAIDDDTGNMGFGVTNASGVLTDEDTPGDNGVFIVDMTNDWQVTRLGARRAEMPRYSATTFSFSD